ncbi:MAG: helix-turn-helix domain-containing protein [Actinomycetota bacterium]|nr:helix-turn-helix domain-containing protein [Actinomycetota bacterium]
MTAHDDQPTRVDEAFAAYLEYLDGTGAEPDVSTLDSAERAEYERDVATAHALSASTYEPPPLEEDPIAIRFGFNRAGSDTNLSGPRLREARKDAGLSVEQLATALTDAGQSRSTAEVFRLEQAATSEVTVAFIGVLAAVLDVAVADLEASDSRLVSDFRAFLASDAFDAEIERWAREHHADVAELRSAARRELAGASFRNAQHSPEQWLALLRAFLEGRSR